MSFAYTLLALNLIALRQAPPGAQLHIRLTTPVGSYASRAGDPVTAVLIAPVTFGVTIAPSSSEQFILPQGSLVSGTVKSVQRVGLGIRHENAAFDLAFTGVTLPNGDRLPIASRVLEVDTGRERVTPGGSIRGARTTSTLSYRTGGYIRTALQWEPHFAVASWAIKTLLLQVPEPELYYPAGVELTLALTQPLFAPLIAAPAAETQIVSGQAVSGEERSHLADVAAAMPLRTHTVNLIHPARNRPSDLINLLFIGSREELTTAFESAGWTQPDSPGLRTSIRRIRAVAEGRGDATAPMSLLAVEGSAPDMAWQKGFNDVSKRHHFRIWKQPETWLGREIWIAAATRDIDFAYMRPGRPITHKIGENIDEERDKVVNDLLFTSCAAVLDSYERPDLPTVTRNATGDPMKTDTRLAIVQLNECHPPSYLSHDDGPVLRSHGRGIQRIARREILSLRSDLLRENLYWRIYEGIRWMAAAAHQRREAGSDDLPVDPATVALGLGSQRSRAVREILQ
jgi:LssY-like putative type I secretion system component LssY